MTSRKSFSILGSLALATLLLSLASAEDWPHFLGPTANGVSKETGLLDRWDEKGPPLVWSKAIGTGYAAPSVRDGQLVLHHRRFDFEIIEAMDAKTGKTQWRHSYPSHYIDPYGYNNGPRCTPLLTRDRCYTFGAEGRLDCLNRKNGKLIWEHETAKDFTVPQAFFGVGSSPILESGLLIVMVGGQPNSGIVAFDPKTGKVVWESVGKDNWEGLPKKGWRGEPPVVWKDYAQQASYATPVAATIHGKRHVLCLMRQGLVSVDPTTGKINFSFWFRATVHESVNAMAPVVKDDLILISAAYYKIGSVLLRVHPDGKGVDEVWRDTVLEVHWTRPILYQGYLYAFSGRNEPDARFRCVEFKTGKLMWDRDESWRHGFDPPKVYGRGSAILADGKLIVLGEGGLLGLFKPNPRRLEEICRHQVEQLKYPSWAAPVLSNKRVYLRNENRLLCYDFSKP